MLDSVLLEKISPNATGKPLNDSSWELIWSDLLSKFCCCMKEPGISPKWAFECFQFQSHLVLATVNSHFSWYKSLLTCLFISILAHSNPSPHCSCSNLCTIQAWCCFIFAEKPAVASHRLWDKVHILSLLKPALALVLPASPVSANIALPDHGLQSSEAIFLFPECECHDSLWLSLCPFFFPSPRKSVILLHSFPFL